MILGHRVSCREFKNMQHCHSLSVRFTETPAPQPPSSHSVLVLCPEALGLRSHWISPSLAQVQKVSVSLQSILLSRLAHTLSDETDLSTLY